ncbi:MAG TPA: hypothetical protein DIW23_05680 [Anaerolineae bacterium]|nr:hypothetical protein [Anaerolineae bacterium]
MKLNLKLLFVGVTFLLSSSFAVELTGYIWAILLTIGILSVCVWLYLIYIESHVYYMDNRENTRYVRLAHALGDNPKILRLMELSMRAHVRIWGQASQGPIKFVADTDVPISFLARFLELSDNTYPCEISKFADGEVWKEGTKVFGECRQLANQLLDYFEQLDWIKRANGGPNRTRWSRSEIHPGLIKVAFEIPTNQAV